MKKSRIILTGLIFCGATMFITSCGEGRDGKGDDHATQNETIDTDETMTEDDDMMEDTTMVGDTTTIM